jgi:hypothetical protein
MPEAEEGQEGQRHAGDDVAEWRVTHGASDDEFMSAGDHRENDGIPSMT